jgi:hypothetical protein
MKPSPSHAKSVWSPRCEAVVVQGRRRPLSWMRCGLDRRAGSTTSAQLGHHRCTSAGRSTGRFHAGTSPRTSRPSTHSPKTAATGVTQSTHCARGALPNQSSEIGHQPRASCPLQVKAPLATTCLWPWCSPQTRVRRPCLPPIPYRPVIHRNLTS